MSLAERFEDARDEVALWCQGRFWPGRAALLLWLAYVAVQHLRDDDYQSIFGALDLGIHEGGHLLFSFLGDFLTTAGGTLTQLAVPIIAGVMFVRQRDYFAVAVAGCWLAMNLYGVATYMADAREMDLPLVTVGGGEAGHDWNTMLDTLGLLAWDTKLAGLTRLGAFVTMWSALAAGAWMLVRMARSQTPARD
jgi:hypothetical protein